MYIARMAPDHAVPDEGEVRIIHRRFIIQRVHEQGTDPRPSRYLYICSSIYMCIGLGFTSG